MTTTGTDSRWLRLGTRGSRLALTQSGQVAEALMAAGGGGAHDGEPATIETISIPIQNGKKFKKDSTGCCGEQQDGQDHRCGCQV